jgi:hypothetical protein
MEYYGDPSRQFFPRALFVPLLFVSLAVPSIPVLLFVDRPFWMIWILGGCLLWGITNLVGVRSSQARPLTNLEKFLVVIAEVFTVSTIAFVVATGFVLVKLLSSVVGIGSIYVRILWYAAIANACFFLLGAWLTVSAALLEAFFPKTGVGNASLFPGFTAKKVFLRVLLALFGIALLVVLAREGWSYAYVAMLVVLMIASAPVSTAFDRQKQSTKNPPPFDAVKALLLASGYKMFERLQTGELALDRLIAVFDMVAHKDGTALAIQFKTSASGSEPVTWAEASSLRTAVWAIYQGAEKQHVKMTGILPLLVLYGRVADPNLTTFAERESIGLAVLPSDAPLEKIAKGEFTLEHLRAMAGQYFATAFRKSSIGRTSPLTPEPKAW